MEAGRTRPAAPPLGCVLLEEADGVTDRHDGLGCVVRNFDVEFFLERHDELDGVETVRTKVINEVGVVLNLLGLDAQMFDNDLLHAISDVTHRIVLTRRWLPPEMLGGSGMKCRNSCSSRICARTAASRRANPHFARRSTPLNQLKRCLTQAGGFWRGAGWASAAISGCPPNGF